MNWYATEEAGGYFKREWVDEVTPLECAQVRKVKEVRSWDIAASLPSEVYPNPDYTVGVKMSLGVDGYYYIEHAEKFRERIHVVQKTMRDLASSDGERCWITFPAEPGAAGKIAQASHAKNLAGFKYKIAKTSAKKIERFLPFASAAQAGLVKIVKGDYCQDPKTREWYKHTDLLTDLEVDIGSRKVKDDTPDAISDGFDFLANGKKMYDNIDISAGYADNQWS